MPTTQQRFSYTEIPAFRLYDKLHVWEFHWLDVVPTKGSNRPTRRVYKFKDLRVQASISEVLTFAYRSIRHRRFCISSLP